MSCGNPSPKQDTVAEVVTSMRPTWVRPIYESGHSFSRSGNGRRWSLRVTASSVNAVERQSARVAEEIIRDVLAQGHIPTKVIALSRKIGDLLPTPTVQDSENNAGPAQFRRNTYPLNVIAGGPVNPMWGEWLIGFPLGWTDLKPLETLKFQQWIDSHGKSSME